MNQLKYKILVITCFFFFTCSVFKKSSLSTNSSTGETSDNIIDSLITLEVIYFHPNPYKRIYVDNVPNVFRLIHKSKPRIKAGSGLKSGRLELDGKEAMLGYPLDSFYLEETYTKMLPLQVYEQNLYSPEQSYVVENLTPYYGETLFFPLTLNYQCCLNDKLELREQWVIPIHGGVPPECPCTDKVYRRTPMEKAVKVTSDDSLIIKPVYIHPNPYKEIVVDNVPISVNLKHKTKAINLKVSSNIEGKRNIFVPQAIEGVTIDSFNLEIAYLNDQSNVIFSPEVPYVVHDIRTYLGTEMIIPYFLNHPCCLDDNLELKQMVLTSEGTAMGDCPCK